MIGTAKPKPPAGQFTREKQKRARAWSQEERNNKAMVRLRDGGCRWPLCSCRAFSEAFEVAHIVAKSLGGPSTTANMIGLCPSRHRGTPSLHSKQLEVRPRTEAGADGPCDFWAKHADGTWRLVGSEP